MTWNTIYNTLKSDYPKFKLVEKQDSNGYYATTIGYKVYMPKIYMGTWAGANMLRHEAVHIRQHHEDKWFKFKYLFWLPAVWTMRSKYEFEAYNVTLKCIREDYGKITKRDIKWIAKRFTGPAYFWMCPFPKKVEDKLRKMVNEL